MEYPYPPPFFPELASWPTIAVGMEGVLALAAAIALVRGKSDGGSRRVALWSLASALVAALTLSVAFVVEDRHRPPNLYEWFCGGVTTVVVGLMLLRAVVHHPQPSQAFIAVFVAGFIGVVGFGLAVRAPLMREAARRVNCHCRVKILGSAMHGHESQYGAFPPAWSGDVPVSWRVKLLPFLNRAELHAQYDMTARWDQPANHPVGIVQVNTYRCPTDCALLPPAGADELKPSSFAMLKGPHTIGRDTMDATKISDVRDGLTNTIAIIEACGQNLKWVETRDVDISQLPLAINAPGRKSGESHGCGSSRHATGAHVLMADGSARILAQSIDEMTLQALATIDGGETVRDQGR